MAWPELELFKVSMRGGSSFTRFAGARRFRPPFALSSPSLSLPPRLRDGFCSAATEEPDGLTERPPATIRGGGAMERGPSGELA